MSSLGRLSMAYGSLAMAYAAFNGLIPVAKRIRNFICSAATPPIRLRVMRGARHQTNKSPSHQTAQLVSSESSGPFGALTKFFGFGASKEEDTAEEPKNLNDTTTSNLKDWFAQPVCKDQLA